MKLKRLVISAAFLFVGSGTYAGDLMPKLVSDGKSGRVEFPASFIKAVKADYPSLRVPIGKDITGNWKQGHPYAAWSDFNGDSLTDIAIILVSDTHQKQAIYHQTNDGSYVYADPIDFRGMQINKEIGPPQDGYVQLHPYDSAWLVRRETDEMDTKGYRSYKEARYWVKYDGVIFGTYESEFSLTYWHDGKYRTLGSGVD